MNKIIIAVIVAFVAGTFTTGTLVSAAPGDQGQPFEALWDAIRDLQNRVSTLETSDTSALSCENQFAIKRVTDEFEVDEECLRGYDLGIELSPCPILSRSESRVCEVVITNFGPDDATDVSFTFTDDFSALVSNNCVSPCFVGDIPIGGTQFFPLELISVHPTAPSTGLTVEVEDTHPLSNTINNKSEQFVNIGP